MTSWMHAETVMDAETLCRLALYPQQELKILRNPESFSLKQRIGNLGPVAVGEHPIWHGCAPGMRRTT